MSISYVNGLPVFDEEYAEKVFELIPEATHVMVERNFITKEWFVLWGFGDGEDHLLASVYNPSGKEQTIERKWKPRLDEKFFSIDFNTEFLYWEYKWYGSQNDERLYHRGLCFKTADDAIACAKKMIEAVRKEKV